MRKYTWGKFFSLVEIGKKYLSRTDTSIGIGVRSNLRLYNEREPVEVGFKQEAQS